MLKVVLLQCGLHKQYAEYVSDLAIDAVMTIFTYINRYDESRDTSAFAFVTQLAYNSIVASLRNINNTNRTMITGLDFFDNINTIDNPTAAFTATNKFLSQLEE